MNEKYQRFVAEIIQLNSIAKQDYADMQNNDYFWDECEDYVEGYEEGYEDAKEYFGNLINKLSKILRNLEIEDTMDKQSNVSERQLKLL